MPSSKSTRLPSQKDLARLQRTILRAALLGEPLAGGVSARLADQAFILRHPHIYLLDENLARPMSVKDLPKPLRIVSLEDIRRETSTQGDVAYLRFLPPQPAEDGIWLTLEGRLASKDVARPEVGLSRIQVKLRKIRGRWESTGDARALAD